MNQPQIVADKFLESLPARDTFPINRTETVELLAKFHTYLSKVAEPAPPAPTCTVCGTPMKAGFVCPDCGSTPECSPLAARPQMGTCGRHRDNHERNIYNTPCVNWQPVALEEAQVVRREGTEWQEEAALFDEIWFSAYMKEPNSDGCCRMCGRYGLNPEATRHNDVCRVPALRQIIREHAPSAQSAELAEAETSRGTGKTVTELLKLWASGQITKAEYDYRLIHLEWERVWNPERKRFVWRERCSVAS